MYFAFFFFHTNSLSSGAYLMLRARLSQTSHTASARYPHVATGHCAGKHSPSQSPFHYSLKATAFSVHHHTPAYPLYPISTHTVVHRWL